MELQEIFNKASAHLLGMTGPSLDSDNDACVYRGRSDDYNFDGSMCAVGVFITDEFYSDDFEGNGITGCQNVANAVSKSLGQDRLTDAQLLLFGSLQDAHDETSRSDCGDDTLWSDNIVIALDGVADKYHLRFDPIPASAIC